MKPLSETLRKNGFDYSLLLRGKKACVYIQRYDENIIYYEVFIIKIKPERTFKGRVIEEGEVFPHNEAFGLWAWTYRSYEKAYQKFLELENKKREE